MAAATDPQRRRLKHFRARRSELGTDWLCARELTPAGGSVGAVARELAALARAGLLDRGQKYGRAWYRLTASGESAADEPYETTSEQVQQAIRGMAKKPGDQSPDRG